MRLSHVAITKALPRDKPRMLADGAGLYLLVQPNGSKLWRLRYRFGGRANMLALGTFPSVSLTDARARRDEARALIANGTDPSVQRKLDRITAETIAGTTFGLVAADYLAHMEGNGAAEATMSKARWMLQDLARPLDRRPISDVRAAEILDLLKRVEKSGRRETARAAALAARASRVEAISQAIELLDRVGCSAHAGERASDGPAYWPAPLSAMSSRDDIEWSRVVMPHCFHYDGEGVGLPW